MEFALGDLGVVERFVNNGEASAVREALRALLLANNGVDLAPGAVGVLEAPLTVVVDPDGSARLVADDDIGRLLGIVARAQSDGSWLRLKACPACGWAFYDRSRNRSRTWCTMSTCGNRAKARSYRARHR